MNSVVEIVGFLSPGAGDKDLSISPPNKKKVVAPIVKTFVISSIKVPLINSSGDMNREEPHHLPISLGL